MCGLPPSGVGVVSVGVVSVGVVSVGVVSVRVVSHHVVLLLPCYGPGTPAASACVYNDHCHVVVGMWDQ